VSNQGEAMGAPAVTLKRCPVCERRVGSQDEFCWMCGAGLTAPPTPAAEPPIAELRLSVPDEAVAAEPQAVAGPQRAGPRLPDSLSRPRPERLAMLVLVLLAVLVLGRFALPRSAAPAPAPTAAAVVLATTPAPSLTPTPQPTDTPSPTATPTATAKPTDTATPTPLPTRIYTVKSGDTLLDIAAQYNVTVEDILAANPGLTEQTRLQIDQQIVIPWPTATVAPTSLTSPTPMVAAATAAPGATAAPAQPPSSFAYTVQTGDTLLDIADRYGVPVEIIRQANGIQTDLLQIGQTLTIPLPTPGPSPTFTPGPSPTPTPRPPYEPPVLLSPPNDASLGLSDAVVLQWTSVGILGEGEWYQVTIINADAPGAAPYRVTTKATSLRLPPELRPKVDAPQTFHWNVVVVREAGTYSDGSPRYITLSPVPPLRTLIWQGNAPTVTPTTAP